MVFGFVEESHGSYEMNICQETRTVCENGSRAREPRRVVGLGSNDRQRLGDGRCTP